MSELKLTSYFDENDESWGAYIDGGRFLAHISPMGGIMFEEKNTTVSYKALPFYDDVKILRIIHVDPEEDLSLRIFFLKYGDDYVFLDGEIDPIDEVNEAVSVKLEDDNVLDYLKFFCSFTTSDEDEDIYFIEGEDSEFFIGISDYNKKRILRDYTKAEVSGFNKKGICTISARVLYNDTEYNSVFEVQRNGEVEMVQDEFL